MSPTLPEAPTADEFRALARSSPWRFRTLHWTHHERRRDVGEQRTEAWLERPGRLTVRGGGGVHVIEGAPYGVSAVLTLPAQDERADAAPRPARTGPGAAPGLAPPEPGLAPPSTLAPPGPPAPSPLSPTLRPDGLVVERPQDYHLDHGDPMWSNYVWTAMLDPEELSHDVGLTDVYAADRHGRPTWWATATPGAGYDPRCGCCPILMGEVSVELEYGPRDEVPELWESHGFGSLPTAYLAGLDVQTGIVVDVTPLDGSGGTRLSNEIHAVDEDLHPPLP